MAVCGRVEVYETVERPKTCRINLFECRICISTCLCMCLDEGAEVDVNAFLA